MANVNTIPIRNIYYMLSYAFQVLRQGNYEMLAGEAFDNIQDLFAAILSKGIAQQLKQGLYCEYVNKTEDLSVMHGKIELNGTIRNYVQCKRLLSCEYDDLSVNNAFNQIIKATACLLLREKSVRTDSRDTLKKEMMFFSDVELIDPLLIRWDMLHYGRNNQSYRMLLGICRFMLEGLLLTEKNGTYKLAHFLDEQRICRLYEKFILEFYRREMPEIKANASRIEWQIEDGDTTFLPEMQSDIMLTCGKKTLIIDAKYYTRSMQEQFGKRSLHSANVYQIFTYVKNKDVGDTGNVAGMLLYAKTDESVIPQDISVKMGNNWIHATNLDLNCDFESISARLKDIARKYLIED